MPRNQRIIGHSLEGTTHIFRPDMPPYDPADDTEPGYLIVGHGMWVKVVAVFMDWNGVDGLDMLYVTCDQTGHSTHVTPRELHVGPLTDAGHLPFSPEVPC